MVGEYSTQAEAAWKELVQRYMLQDAERVLPQVTLALTDNWMEFTLRYVVDYRSRRLVKDRLFTALLKSFDSSGGKIAIASTTVHLVDAPPLKLVVDQGLTIQRPSASP